MPFVRNKAVLCRVLEKIVDLRDKKQKNNSAKLENQKNKNRKRASQAGKLSRETPHTRRVKITLP